MENKSLSSLAESIRKEQHILYPAQTDVQSTGQLEVNVTSFNTNVPIPDAVISITTANNPTNIIEQIRTDSSGKSQTISLPTPPIDYSLEPSSEQPYSQYTLVVQSQGFENVTINGAQLLPDVKAVQPIRMLPQSSQGTSQEFTISPHTLFGDYPPKIAEAEIKPVDERGEVVLSKVVIPEFVVVHDGPPRDTSAANYYVRYRDYIANVASSEIYATWPEATIYANILAIMSFTLNRVYTEW